MIEDVEEKLANYRGITISCQGGTVVSVCSTFDVDTLDILDKKVQKLLKLSKDAEPSDDKEVS